VVIRINLSFWIAYILFCVLGILGLQLTGKINLATLEFAEQVILTVTFVSCGIVIKHWYDKNPNFGKDKPESK
jgi:hypothetical protein